VGSAGSFTELTGDPVSDSVLADWDAGITAGEFYVRILEGATGTVTRHAVSVDPATDDIETLAARLDAIDGLSASVASGTLHIQADTGHHFDFLPAVASEPYTSTLTGTAEPTLSGIYTGSANQVYTVGVTGGGQVGLTSGLGLEVRNGAGELVRTLDVGAGYAAGDRLELDDGLYVSLSAGTLSAGEEFTVQALTGSDPTGVLAAAGINTLFSGHSMSTLSVRADVLADPRRLATAVGPDGTDNVNIRRLADLGTTAADSLDGQTPLEACQRIVTDLGQEVAVRQARKDASDSLLQELENQRSGSSGVDLNEESARLLVFQQMFQSMAKYISVLDRSMQSLLEVL
jgi:flagellar hook-associated protein FlgK